MPLPEGSSSFTVHFQGHIVTVEVFKPATYVAQPLVIVMPGVERSANNYRNYAIDVGVKCACLIAAIHLSELNFSDTDYGQGKIFPDSAYDPTTGALIQPTHVNPRSEWTLNIVLQVFEYIKISEGNPDLIYYLFGHGEGGQFVNTFSLFLYPLLSREDRPIRMIVGDVGTAIFPGPPIMRESAIKVNRSKCYTGPNCELTSYPCGTNPQSACPCLYATDQSNGVVSCHPKNKYCNCSKCFVDCGFNSTQNDDQSSLNEAKQSENAKAFPCSIAKKQIKCSDFIIINNTAVVNEHYNYPHNPFVFEDKCRFNLSNTEILPFPYGFGNIIPQPNVELYLKAPIVFYLGDRDVNVNGGINPQCETIFPLPSGPYADAQGPFRLFKDLNCYLSGQYLSLKLDIKCKWKVIIARGCDHNAAAVLSIPIAPWAIFGSKTCKYMMNCDYLRQYVVPGAHPLPP